MKIDDNGIDLDWTDLIAFGVCVALIAIGLGGCFSLAGDSMRDGPQIERTK